MNNNFRFGNANDEERIITLSYLQWMPYVLVVQVILNIFNTLKKF